MGVAMAQRGRPRPLFGRSGSGTSCGAFPFSVVENLLIGAMGAAARRRGEKEEEGAGGEKTKMSKGALPLPSFITIRRPTAGLHDRTQ